MDPVRFIGNYSSGKMGYAIAEQLAKMGANVLLVSGPVSIKPLHKNIKKIAVKSADEMFEHSTRLFPETDGAVMCAAVADYKPVISTDKKIKRTKGNFTIELQPNRDIAAKLGELKNDLQLLVGFALETNNEFENASKKLNKKNLDFIVLNSLNDVGAGFQTDTNKITIIDKHNKTFKFELKSKKMVAKDIVDHMIRRIAL